MAAGGGQAEYGAALLTRIGVTRPARNLSGRMSSVCLPSGWDTSVHLSAYRTSGCTLDLRHTGPQPTTGSALPGPQPTGDRSPTSREPILLNRSLHILTSYIHKYVNVIGNTIIHFSISLSLVGSVSPGKSDSHGLVLSEQVPDKNNPVSAQERYRQRCCVWPKTCTSQSVMMGVDGKVGVCIFAEPLLSTSSGLGILPS